MSTPSDQHSPSASEAYEIEVVKVPLVKRLIGGAITLGVGVISAGTGVVPYRNTQLVVRDRATGNVVGTIVPDQADATDVVAEAQHSWAEDSKLEFDRRWLQPFD
jgi:hypothetical protein